MQSLHLDADLRAVVAWAARPADVQKTIVGVVEMTPQKARDDDVGGEHERLAGG